VLALALEEWGQLAGICGVVIAAVVVISGRIDRIHKHIDEHMLSEESSIEGVHAEIRGARAENAETQKDVAYIAGQLDIDLRRRGK
jgi:hypothetical protein